MEKSSSFPAIACILLAAGASRRLGRPKQLVEHQGETLLRRAVRAALSTPCRPVVVVTGAHAEEVERAIAGEPVEVARNADWEQGMSTSVRAGKKRALECDPRLEALLFLVVDQPFLDAAHLDRLLWRYRRERPPVVASMYNGRPGVPALFDRTTFAELDRLEGDSGARALFRHYREELVTVDFPEGKFDVDTPDDLGFLRPL